MNMCGLGCYYKSESFDLSSIDVRGPDDRQIVETMCGVQMYFARLAIVDTSKKGMQPFTLDVPWRRLTWMVNGEIYNYGDLCSLLPDDIKLVSSSDCEIIGGLYLKYGWLGMLSRLDAEYACVLLDENIDTDDFTLYAARDRYGVRPLYVGYDDESFSLSSVLAGLDAKYSNRKQVEPGVSYIFKSKVSKITVEKSSYRPFSEFSSYTDSLLRIKSTLTEAVQKRLVSDRPLACLLSGGLDSSLVCSIAQKLLGGGLHTYTIGLTGGTDLEHAREVADFIGSTHHECLIDVSDALQAIDEVIYTLGSWDTTTVRASIFQYLMGKHIAATSDHKVILTGEGSDELTGGYLYFHKAPHAQAFDDECRRLLSDIYLTDGLRVDRAMSCHGLEVRIPFLDTSFVESYLQISLEERYLSGAQEKYLLRKSFDDGTYLPDSVLWRKKEAFSDGVSTEKDSWFSLLQQHIEGLVSDDEFTLYLDENRDSPSPLPETKEQYYYRKKFEEFYGKDAVGSIPYYWMPKWIEGVKDPSARVLEVY